MNWAMIQLNFSAKKCFNERFVKTIGIFLPGINNKHIHEYNTHLNTIKGILCPKKEMITNNLYNKYINKCLQSNMLDVNDIAMIAVIIIHAYITDSCASLISEYIFPTDLINNKDHDSRGLLSTGCELCGKSFIAYSSMTKLFPQNKLNCTNKTCVKFVEKYVNCILQLEHIYTLLKHTWYACHCCEHCFENYHYYCDYKGNITCSCYNNDDVPDDEKCLQMYYNDYDRCECPYCN